MPPKLILIIGYIFVFYVIIRDYKRSERVSKALWWPLIWYMVVSSRPIGVWFGIWGLPMGASGGGVTGGSPIDRNFYLALSFIGIVVLINRKFNWGKLFTKNSWLTMLLLFMILSISWSEFSFVSFKRFVKIVGAIIMALVVLTEQNPMIAITTIIRRCAYLHLPMSIIVIRYFRNIGITFDWTGSAQSWQGITSSKNVLGQVAMVAAFYFLWEIVRNWKKSKWKSLKSINLVYFLMGAYLLKGSDNSLSLTSVSVFCLATFIFFRLKSLGYNIQRIRRFMNFMMAGTLSFLSLITVHSIVGFSEESLFGKFITTFGRDITLTDRTIIWNDIYNVVRNPLLGVGFGGFWIGEIMNIPFSAGMTWTLGQAHSGYVDTYLQIGLVGVFLLIGLIIKTPNTLLKSYLSNVEFSWLRVALFITIVYINITETTFLRGDHHLWFLLMIITINLPLPSTPSHRRTGMSSSGTIVLTST